MLAPRRRLATMTSLTLALVVLTACGDDSPTEATGDALTVGETQEVVTAFFDLLELIEIPLLDGGGAPVAGPAAVPYGDLYDDVIDGQIQCDLPGGTATAVGLITGDVDPVAETADIMVSATVDAVNCAHVGETSTITLDGDPDVGLGGEISITPVSIDITIDVDGGFSFTTDDGRTGTCPMDFTVTASSSEGGLSEVISGTACGVNAAQLQVSLFD